MLSVVRLCLLAFVASMAIFPSAAPSASPFAYISNKLSSDVSVVDVANNGLVATIPVVGIPIGVAVNASGTRAYVANYFMMDGTSWISVIDTATNKVLRNVPAGLSAYGLALNPAGTRLYIANAMQGANSVSVMDTTTNAVVATIGVGSFPMGIVVNRTGTRAYVSNDGNASVTAIDLAANKVVATAAVGVSPMGIAVNSAGTRIYVANQGDNTVSVMDATTLAKMATVQVGGGPMGIAINPADTEVYVANEFANSVSVIDAATNAVVATIPVGSVPKGVAFDPTGTHAVVATYGAGKAAVIDTARRVVIANVGLHLGPIGLGQFIVPSGSSPPPPDTTPPVVSISSPTGGNVSGTLTVSASASDNVGVARVDFYVNGGLVDSDSAAPYQYSWDTTKLANGSVTLRAVAFDGAGNSTQSAIVTVNVANVVVPPPDTTPPTVNVSSPTGGNVSGTVTVSANASDDVGVARVDFYVNGGLVGSGSAAPYQYSWDTTKLANGSAALRAVAFDAAGNSTQSAIVTVNVANGGPGLPPVLQSAVSRKTHGAAGTFDLPLSLVQTNPTTEPRQGPLQTIICTFDKAISGANVTVTEGTAIASAPIFSGNEVTVALAGAPDQQYVTVVLSNVSSADGGSGGTAVVRIGLLLGDVNQSRIVTTLDMVVENGQLGKPLSASNFMLDVNVSGALTVLDKVVINGQAGKALPAP